MTIERTLSESVKNAVRKAYDGICQYCTQNHGFHVDHIVALKNGGTDEIGNLTLACESCNLRKGTIQFPESYLILLLGIAERKKNKILKILEKEKLQVSASTFNSATNPQRTPRKQIADVYFALHPDFKFHSNLPVTFEMIDFLKELMNTECPAQVVDSRYKDFVNSGEFHHLTLTGFAIYADGITEASENFIRIAPSLETFTIAPKSDQREIFIIKHTFTDEARKWLENVNEENLYSLKLRRSGSPQTGFELHI